MRRLLKRWLSWLWPGRSATITARPGQSVPGGRMLIRRYDGAGDPPPLHWKACHPSTQHLLKAQLTCAQGHGITLRSHSVAADGRVQPSIVCRTPGCDFHEVARLDKWDRGPLE